MTDTSELLVKIGIALTQNDAPKVIALVGQMDDALKQATKSARESASAMAQLLDQRASQAADSNRQLTAEQDKVTKSARESAAAFEELLPPLGDSNRGTVEAASATSEFTKTLEKSLGPKRTFKLLLHETSALLPGLGSALRFAFSPISGLLLAGVAGLAAWINHVKQAKQQAADMARAIADAAGATTDYNTALNEARADRLQAYAASWGVIAEKSEIASRAARAMQDAQLGLIGAETRNKLSRVDAAEESGAISHADAARERFMINAAAKRKEAAAAEAGEAAQKSAQASQRSALETKYTAAVAGVSGLGGEEAEVQRQTSIKFLQSAQESLDRQIKIYAQALSNEKDQQSPDAREFYKRMRALEGVKNQDESRLADLRKQSADYKQFNDAISGLAGDINKIAAAMRETASIEAITKADKARQRQFESDTLRAEAQREFNLAVVRDLQEQKKQVELNTARGIAMQGR